METGFLQGDGFLSLTTPFGANVLLLDGLEGSEAISELFEFNLFMRSTSLDLDPVKIIGKSATVTMAVDKCPTRYINGIVTKFIQTGYDRDFCIFKAVCVPKLWLLTRSRRRKIYQAKSVEEIIKAVLGEFAISFTSKLTKTYDALDYCVQYDESAFDFISRLMEKNGIYYFFEFTSGGHSMILADASSAHVVCPKLDKIRFFPRDVEYDQVDTIYQFEYESRLGGKTAVISDYDFVNPTTSLRGTHSASAGSGSVFEFGAGQTTAAAAEAIAKLRVEAQNTDGTVLRGSGFSYPLYAGVKFTLSDHFNSALNQSYFIRRLRHIAINDRYLNHFEAFPESVAFRAPLSTTAPRAYGGEIGVVVGPKGEEVWTDQYGRVKVQFPWDEDGKKDEKSSMWIRVAQNSAGKGYGFMFLPRIGNEVVVAYLNGDPDRPLVTGSVYNGDNSTPVTLPANSTQSTIKTLSSKKGVAGNEIRFEDKKDSEELYLHAQKDYKVEIENDMTTTLKAGSEVHTVEKGSRTVSIKAGDEVHSNEKKFSHTVKGDYILKIDGKLSIVVGGAIEIKSDASISLNAGSKFTAEASQSVAIKAGTTLASNAGTSLVNKAGTSLTNQAGTDLINKASLQLSNKAAIINSKADATHTVEAGAMMTVKGAIVQVN